MRLIRSASRLQRGGGLLSAATTSHSASPSLPARPSSLTSAPRRTPLITTPWAATSLSPFTGTRTYASSSQEPLRKTALYDLHVSLGGKMVPFGGFHMPVQYAALSVSESHKFTRTHASIFDVSHMVQRIFQGPGAAAFLERVTPAGLAGLPVNGSTLSALLHPGTGGIVDDTIITKLAPDTFYVVTNAACRDKDDAYLAQQLAAFDGPAVAHEKHDQKGLIALQGPRSAEILASLLADTAATDLTKLYFGSCTTAKFQLPGNRVSGDVLVSRGGYTGEDGFEVSIPNAEETVALTRHLLDSAGPEKLQMAGLGARDSLRLEAGMCLYGHDLDDTTTPVEAGLSWIIPKTRRAPDAGFHGAGVISAQLVPQSKGGSGVTRRRVGFIVEGAPAREGAEIVVDGETVGKVTSGCPSPTLGKNIAMGYIKNGLHKAGTEVEVLVRGKPRKAVVAKMPFVPTKYWKGTAPA